MVLVINRVHLHHFMSFDDATVDLQNKGYCLIQGVNKNPKDAAKSNGSGKSTLFNAISYALVGETLQGLKSNLSNIYFSDGCYVELEFNIDNTEYKIIRSKEDSTYGTNLKLYINGEDKSGKGIRESQAILDQLLPDLTTELIGSVIMLGQGLPQKFTSNTPSGRKEVLEHLSKSDFMIQDLKARIEARGQKLNKESLDLNNKIIALTSASDIYTQQLRLKQEAYSKYNVNTDFDSKIKETTAKLESLEVEIKLIDQDISSLNLESYSNDFANKNTEKQEALNKVKAQHDSIERTLNSSYIELCGKINLLTNEIKRLESITDVCPTCGQKIPGAHKPDTSSQKIELETLNKQKILKEEEIKKDKEEYEEVLKEIGLKFDENIKKAKIKLDEALTKSQSLSTKRANKLTLEKEPLLEQLTTLKSEQANWTSNKQNLEKEIEELKASIEKNNKDKEELEKSLGILTTHIETLNKMNTLIKRDFRGILLSNIISYINMKSQEYCAKIFDTKEIEFTLNGNDLDIIFCGKDYENLSGGEKQRIDIIIQFAIRDMMSNYLSFSSNILVLDEITDALDKVSCDKVINFITTELKDIESIFIISHHAEELDIPVDTVITIEKDIRGVSSVL